MIRTALTLNISAQDAQNVSFLANGTQLGLLSSTAPNIHVQTCHRPLQLIVSIRADEEPASSASLAHQRQQITAWQNFYQLLSRRGSAELNSLMHQYHLQPDWLLCLDEHRLQAWLPYELGFYLLRQNELRRLRSTMPRDSAQATTTEKVGADQTSAQQYYALNINPDDHFFILPPTLLSYYSAGEAAGLLLGLRQLPAKMSDLFNTARLRGYYDESSWLALQVLRLDEDHLPEASQSFLHQAGMHWFNRLWQKPRQNELDDSGSDSVGAEEIPVAEEEPPVNLYRKILANKKLSMLVGASLLIVLVLALIFAFMQPSDSDPSANTIKESMTSQTTHALTPTPTVKPTVTAESTNALPQLVVAANQLNLREEPDRKSRQLKQLKSGDKLIQLAQPEGDWVKVQTEDGTVGYVFYSYVKTAIP